MHSWERVLGPALETQSSADAPDSDLPVQRQYSWQESKTHFSRKQRSASFLHSALSADQPLAQTTSSASECAVLLHTLTREDTAGMPPLMTFTPSAWALNHHVSSKEPSQAHHVLARSVTCMAMGQLWQSTDGTAELDSLVQTFRLFQRFVRAAGTTAMCKGPLLQAKRATPAHTLVRWIHSRGLHLQSAI